MDLTTAISRRFLKKKAASLRRYVGKVNRPKTSVNLNIGTKRNVAPDSGSRKPG